MNQPKSLDRFDRIFLISNYVTLATACAGLVYADVANVPVSGAPVGYGGEYGWEKTPVTHMGQLVDAVRAFELSPSSLLNASYAPTYGVAWSRSLVLSLGGRRDGLGFAAAYEVTCRAYVAGASFRYVHDCLVFSRRHHRLIRDVATELVVADDHRVAVLGEWSRRSGLRMLDLGAAHNPAPGFESVDLQDASINCDIRDGLPLRDSSVGCIRAYDFLEHMTRCPDSACVHGAGTGGAPCCVGVMNEFYRVLAPGGWILSHTPSSDGRGAFQDPTHVSYWNPNSFWYYTRRDQARFVRGVVCRFQADRVWQGYPDAWHEQHHIPYVDANLVALKGQRQPGICEI